MPHSSEILFPFQVEFFNLPSKCDLPTYNVSKLRHWHHDNHVRHIMGNDLILCATDVVGSCYRNYTLNSIYVNFRTS
jgi:hypothetical protein